jgi:hypothetical protein
LCGNATAPGDAYGGGGLPIVPVTYWIAANPNGHLRGDGSVRKFEIDIGGTPSGSNRIDHIDIVQLGITSGVGLGFDLFCPCSIQGECDSFDTFQHCFGEEAGFADYVLDFWVDNNTGYDVSKLFIPGNVPGNPSTISPTVINYDTPIPAGTPIHVVLNIDVPPGGYSPMEIPIGLMSKDLITGDLFECCASSVSFGAAGFNDCNRNGIPDECEETEFIRGNANNDASVDLGDAVAILTYLFANEPVACLDAADTTDDGQVDISDAIFLMSYQFLNGAAPSAPFPDCGVDPTDDNLECETSSCP